jgi:hypothetical protein
MAKRGLPSPDEGDSLALTFAAPVFTSAMTEVQTQHRKVADTEFNPWDAMRGGPR